MIRKPLRRTVLKPPRRIPPESPAQAATWLKVKNRYTQLGLCNGCAGQAAWGHQCGFALIHPPCPDCAVLIADWPVAKPNGWRTRGGNASRAADSPDEYADDDAGEPEPEPATA